MTTQIEDQFRYRDTQYTVALASGDLFDPRELGLNPGAASTACYRGYCASFGIIESHLVVEHLEIALPAQLEEGGQEKPRVKSIPPSEQRGLGRAGLDYRYANINYELAYSGGVVLGADLLDGYYVRGWQPAWGYGLAFEVVFNDGIMVSEHDRSASMAEIRNNDWNPRMDPLNAEISAFIARSFECAYRW